MASVVQDGERRVKFLFDGTDNRELPLILGQLPVLPKHYWEGRDFERSTLDPPLGSGPYRIKSIDPGRGVVYERVPDYWGADIPVNKGRYNFDEIRYEYYRDPNVALEAFKAGRFDLRVESSSRFWATGYEGPALQRGLITKLEIPTEGGGGMQGFVFNTRRDKFKDPLVRQALDYAFDFEWTNKTLFYGAYTRTASYFANTELAVVGLPGPRRAEAARALPRPPAARGVRPGLPAAGDRRLRQQPRQPPPSRRPVQAGGLRDQGRQAGQRRHRRAVRFEILLDSGGLFERIVGPFAKGLERLGIAVTVRTADDAQYQKRLDTFDFDMVIGNFGQSQSPGNEQRDFWGSAAADQQGSRNLIGSRTRSSTS